MRKNALLALLALFVPIALLAAGCGDDDDSGDDDTEQTDGSNDESSNDESDDESDDEMSADAPDNEDEAIEMLAAALAADGTLTEDQADCVAEFVIDEVGFDRMVEAGFNASNADETPPAELQEDLTAALLDAFGECDVTPSAG
jgi:hypothetical protein